MNSGEAPAWKARGERGTPFMLRFILWWASLLGRRVARWVTLPPTVLYFLATAGAARRASRAFLTRALGRPATLWDVARHIFCFASVVLDRALMAFGGAEELTLEQHRIGVPPGGKQGTLLFVSHLGSFEALRVFGRERAPMKFLLDRRHGAVLTAMLGKRAPDLAASIIDTGQPGPALALEVKQALADGFRVGIMVDRPRAGEKTISAPFFGADAPFPTGPWALAAALQAPVLLGFCLFKGGNRYEGHFELFEEKLVLPRGPQREAGIEACIRRYAARLEHYARSAPYNWFNFYDFWALQDHDAAPR